MWKSEAMKWKCWSYILTLKRSQFEGESIRVKLLDFYHESKFVKFWSLQSSHFVYRVPSHVYSKMCNVRLPYIKHALYVRYKTYVKRMDRAPYV